MDASPPQLPYQSPPPAVRRRPGWWALATLLLAAGVAVLAGVAFGPRAWRDARAAYWKRQCGRYAAAADYVVYDEDPARGAALLQAGGTPLRYNRARAAAGPPDPPASRPPDCWRTMATINNAGIGADAPVVFLHDRASPDGERWLLAVSFEGWRGPRYWQFTSGVYGRDGTTMWQGGVAIHKRPAGSLRMFAGQPDPADASHFTIGYELNGQPGTVDGWVVNGGRVNLRVRDGPALAVGVP